MSCASAAGATPLQELAAYFHAAPARAEPAATPAGLASRLHSLTQANAEAATGLVASLGALAQTAANLVHFSAEISGCARALEAGPTAGAPAAAAAAAIVPPPAKAAPAAAAPAVAIERRSRHRRRVPRPAREEPAPAPPAAAVPAGAAAAPARAEATVEDLDSSSDSSDGYSSRHSPREAAAPASGVHLAGPRPKVSGAAHRHPSHGPGGPANNHPRPASRPAGEAHRHGSHRRGRDRHPGAPGSHPSAGAPVGAWPAPERAWQHPSAPGNHSRAPRPIHHAVRARDNFQPAAGAEAAGAAPRHRSRSQRRVRRQHR